MMRGVTCWASVLVTAAVVALALTACSGSPAQAPSSRNARSDRIVQLAAELHQGDPWPAIRRERVLKLLPAAMDAAKVDAWVVLCRENANDPLAKHVGGENIGRMTAFLFLRTPSGVESRVFAPASEAAALTDALDYAKVVPLPLEGDIFAVLAEQLREVRPQVIAINKSQLSVADGLTATQQDQLRTALGAELSKRMISSEELVTRWLQIKLPAEVEIMRKAAVLTDLLEYEAFDPVVPGKTTNSDVQRFMRARVAQLGFGHAWIDNPGIQSGLDRGRGSDASRVIIPGDVIDIDFGIKVYDNWCSDIQRFAYVLMPGETSAPKQVAYAWESAIHSHRRMTSAMRPGLAGWEIDKVQIDTQDQSGSLRHWASTGHPVGFWAHDAGPSLSGYLRDPAKRGNAMRKIEAGMVFAFDGDFVWAAEDAGEKGTRSITIEEMVFVTPTGAQYLSPVQNDLVLIPSSRSSASR